MTRQLRYVYLEERTLANTRATRHARVTATLDPKGYRLPLPAVRSSHYFAWYHDLLEGLDRKQTDDAPEAAWSLTAMRLGRFIGDPGVQVIPGRPEEIRARREAGASPPAINSLGPRCRTHHYFRVLSAAELAHAIKITSTSISIDVTEEWHAPPRGIISPIPMHSPVLGTHCVCINSHKTARLMYGFEFPRARNDFIFLNSWGNWGNQGWGAISHEDVDRFIVEGHGFGPINHFPPIQAKHGLVIMLWKTAGEGEVHGREIIDAATGERIAWCFLVRRGRFLDVEELFVWPSFRRRGYGSILASLAKELAEELQCELRALIAFADAYPVDRIQLEKIIGLLGLHLHPSSMRTLAFVGLTSPYGGSLDGVRIPLQPTAPLYKLDPATGTRQITVWFGTNRRPIDPGDVSQGFSGERDSVVHYGSCDVTIPKSHQFGSVGSNFFKRWLRAADDRLEIIRTDEFTADLFWKQIANKLAGVKSEDRQGLIYLHGYNVPFDDAAIRAAQLGYDLRFPGETAFFSWPSAGGLEDYPVDEATIEASEHFISDFLIDFAGRTGAEVIHLIAHSMGNRGLLRSLQRIANTAEHAGVKFGQVILAAPDVECDLFNNLADVYRRTSKRTTLYVSPKDLAVKASRWLHGYPRLGLSPPVTVVDGIDTIEVPKLNVFDFLGHGYYAEAEALLHDIFNLLRHGKAPSERQRLLEAQNHDGKTYWVMEE